MKRSTLALSLLTAATLAAAAPALAVEGDGERQEVIVVAADGTDDPDIIDIAGLEVGQSRSASTADGRSVIVSRVEEGFDIDVDGKTTEIRFPDVADLPVAPDGAALTKVFVERRRGDDGAAGAVAYVLTDALDDDELRTRVIEILGEHDGHHAGDVVIAPGGGKRVKVVRVIAENESATGDSAEKADGERRRERVIILRQPATAAGEESESDDTP